ncbi:ABC transporter ATP-binding protein, partial [Streptomyces adustus]
SRATTDLMLVRMFLAFPLTFLLVNGVTIVIGVVIMLLQDWTLGLVILGPTVPLVVMCVVFEERYAHAARLAQDQVGDLTTVVEESVLGIRIVKGFGRHRSQARAFRELARTLRGTELRKARLLAAIWAVIVTLPELAIGAALVVGAVQVADGTLSAGTLVAFLSTALALRWPVESIGFLLAMSQEASTATERFFEVMDAPPESTAPDASPTANGSPAEDGGLRFHGVRFRYPDAPPDSPPLLDHIELHVRPGESMALVGATGSGKTTLTALVPRLHEVTSGRITLDGEDIAAMPREELRAKVAVAFEEPTLFSASVGDNVLMGADGDAGPPELERALAVAQAADFVHALPQGTLTQVGEQGLSLSGGQRQRLALARAVVGRPRFLVLDDPLSALDVHTEAAVEAALRRVLVDTTALIVAHRPSTVLLADRVALLADGRIQAVGTHQELLRTSTEYARLMSGDDPADPSGHEEGDR